MWQKCQLRLIANLISDGFLWDEYKMLETKWASHDFLHEMYDTPQLLDCGNNAYRLYQPTRQFGLKTMVVNR